MTKFIIKKSDIIHNCEEIMANTDALVIPTLKADCYGLGAKEVMELLHESCGIHMFAISRLEESKELVGKGCDLLLLSCYHDMQSIQTIVDNNIICAVDSLGQARRIGEYAKSVGKTCNVHIKIDTGFGRFGFMPGNLPEIKAVFSIEGIKVCGMFSHFSSAFSSPIITNNQFETFMTVISSVKAAGFNPGICHIANSSGFARHKKYHLDAVRIGSLLLGRCPMKHKLNVIKVGRFETEISDIRKLKKGANIGYGNVYTLRKNRKIAILCTGSADGILIKKDYDTFRFTDILRYGLSVFKMFFKDNRLRVKINGKTVKSIGRIALTHTMVDVTGIDCKCADKAVIDISPLYVSANVEREYI